MVLFCHLAAGTQSQPTNLQLVQEQVKLLGRVIFTAGKTLDPGRVQAIQQITSYEKTDDVFSGNVFLLLGLDS